MSTDPHTGMAHLLLLVPANKTASVNKTFALLPILAFVIVLKKHLGDLLKVVVDGLPGHRDHVVKQRHLLESFDSQNLEHDVHDDERLNKREDRW